MEINLINICNELQNRVSGTLSVFETRTINEVSETEMIWLGPSDTENSSRAIIHFHDYGLSVSAYRVTDEIVRNEFYIGFHEWESLKKTLIDFLSV